MKADALTVALALAVFTAACAQTDSGITTNIKSKLAADDSVKARKINVDTKDHVVTLTGTVQSPMEESRALEIARTTDGVRSVVDNINVMAEPMAAPTTGTSGFPPSPIDRPSPDTAPIDRSAPAPIDRGPSNAPGRAPSEPAPIPTPRR